MEMGIVKFSKITGISRASLVNFDKAQSIAAIQKNGKRKYNLDHFLNAEVQRLMKKNDKEIPVNIRRALLGETTPALALALVKSTVKPLERSLSTQKTTSQADLDTIPSGLIEDENLKPLSGMTEASGKIWIFVLKTLVQDQILYKSDLLNLKIYCSAVVQLDKMEMQLAPESFVDVMGKPNCLVAMIDKCRNTITSQAKSLGITASGRKSIGYVKPEIIDSDTQAWGDLLDNVNTPLSNIKK